MAQRLLHGAAGEGESLFRRALDKPISPAAMTRAHAAPGVSTVFAAVACTEAAGEVDMVPPSSWQISPCPTTDAGGLEVLGLDPTLLPKALAIRDWLLTEATQLADPGQILPGLAERLIALAVPIDRIATAVDLLHAQYSGIGRFWTREEGATYRLFPHGPEHDRLYRESPFAYVHGTANGCSSTSHKPPTTASASSPT